jgi:hypothetical protein
MIIDVHSHLVPPDLLAAIREGMDASLRCAWSRTAAAWRLPLPAANRRGRSRRA